MKKDAPGPIHATEIFALGIEGAQLERFPKVGYRYGSITEVANLAWAGMHQDLPIEHLYFVSNDGSEARVEWYVHHHSTDRYVLVKGRLSVALFDAREGSPSYGVLEKLEVGDLSSDLPQGMKIPAGVWHSFKPTGGEFLLFNSKYPGYNQADPDKYRLPMPNEQCDFSWD